MTTGCSTGLTYRLPQFTLPWYPYSDMPFYRSKRVGRKHRWVGSSLFEPRVFGYILKLLPQRGHEVPKKVVPTNRYKRTHTTTTHSHHTHTHKVSHLSHYFSSTNSVNSLSIHITLLLHSPECSRQSHDISNQIAILFPCLRRVLKSPKASSPSIFQKPC